MFFQAEDGIRDLVRSRGLGDVYKRQLPERIRMQVAGVDRDAEVLDLRQQFALPLDRLGPVSYTHLTLPTSDLV